MPVRVSNIRPSLAGGRRKSRASHAAAVRRVSHIRANRVSNGGVLHGKISEAPGLSVSPGDPQQEDGGCCGSVGSRRESAIIVSIEGGGGLNCFMRGFSKFCLQGKLYRFGPFKVVY